MKRKILIIGNPVAGGSAVMKIRKAAEFLETKGHDHVSDLLKKLREHGYYYQKL